MFQTSYIEISRSAVRNNIEFIRKQLGKNVKISSVVKGNAYGHSKEIFVPLAEECGIEHFSVFSASEALRLKSITSNHPQIMIMGMIDNSELEWAIENDIEFYIFEFDRLNAAVKAAKKIKKPAQIHIEVETGMNRTGFKKSELKKVVKIISEKKHLFSVKGFCTHYAGAESIANYLRIQNQLKFFNETYLWLRENGIHPHLKHSACSAAAISYPKTRMDMARIGILQYGFWPSKETYIDFISNKKKKEDPLRRVISWKSKVMSIKEVDTGQFVGYGNTYLALRKMKVAVVPVGYAHGFSRSLSNHGRVLIHKKRVSVIGIVNMNLMTIDVSNIPDVKKGDEVVLIGNQGDLSISVSSFSELSDQVNYELLTRLPQNIPRFVVE